MNETKPYAIPPGMQVDAATVGATIREFRLRRNMPQIELARRIGMRPPPLNNIEKGRNLPSTPVLCRIATALEVPIDTLVNHRGTPHGYIRVVTDVAAGAGFTRPEDEPPAADPGFRHRLSRLTDAYIGLETLCGISKRAAIPLNLPCDPTPQGMEKLASSVRFLLHIGDAIVFDYLELLENAGLRIIFSPMPGEWPSASAYDAQNGNAMLYIADGLNPEKQLFRLIYELGRVYLYTRTLYGGDLPVATPPPDALDTDHAARAFAAAFLMPATAIRATVAQTGVRPDAWPYFLLLRLKHRYGVSAETFNIRLQELDLITPENGVRFRTRIRRHYAYNDNAEPGQSRRILTPNGRLGDLKLIAAINARTPEDRNEHQRLTRLLKKEGVRTP